jgi:2-amino-4-hydroxy-6-hydroxymethyldihydropteridine diphosphokinase
LNALEHYKVFVALGANLGDAPATLRLALQALGHLPQTRLVRASSLYRTAPVQAVGPDFINAVAELSTALEPHDLLSELQALENDHGRLRPYRNAPRTLDLDMLCMFDAHQEVHMNDATLTLPHPRMHERAFVLLPLSEIAPHLVSPAQLAAVADQAITRL